MIVYLFLFDLLNAFNENLTAVHYSIVTPGIDGEVKPGKNEFSEFRGHPPIRPFFNLVNFRSTFA